MWTIQLPHLHWRNGVAMWGNTPVPTVTEDEAAKRTAADGPYIIGDTLCIPDQSEPWCGITITPPPTPKE